MTYRALQAVCLMNVVICAGLTAGSSSSVIIAVPAWAGDVGCRVTRLDTVIAKQRGPSLKFECPAGAEIISCDGPNIEPLDVPLTDVCRSRSLEFGEASVATVSSGATIDGVIRWLDLSKPNHLRIVATRAVVFDRPVAVRVQSRSERYVSFSRLGASPVTVPASALLSRGEWRLPPMQRGGELLVVAEAAAVMPRAIRVPTYPTPFAWGSSRVLSIYGLRTGTPEVVPIFDGGGAGTPVPTTISAGESSFLYVPKGNVGAVALSADSAECGRASSLSIDRTGQTRSGQRAHVVMLTDLKRCEWVVAGLEPGSYRASLRSPVGSGGSAEFAIAAHQTETVALPAPAVTLLGRVRYNGRPVGKLRVNVFRPGVAGSDSTTTDGDGRYSLRLDRPGSYSLSVQSASGMTFPQLRKLNLKNGPNTDEWMLTGGSIAVRVHGGDPGKPVNVELQGPGAVLRNTLERGERTVERHGLPFAVYRVFATQEDEVAPRVSREPKLATLTESAAAASVDLTLVPGTSLLIVTREEGVPVTDAQLSGVSRSGFSLMRLPRQKTSESASGRYSLAHYAPGTEIQVVVPGDFVPVCRIAPFNQTIEVHVTKGRELQVQLPTPGVTRLSPLLGGVAGARGSDCAIPWSAFRATPLPSPSRASRLLIHNFPVSASLMWEMSVPVRQQRQIRIPDTGPLVLDLSRASR